LDMTERFNKLYFYEQELWFSITDSRLIIIGDFIFDIYDIITALKENIPKSVLFDWYSTHDDLEDAEDWMSLYQYINRESISKEKTRMAKSRKQILEDINNWYKIDLQFLEKIVR
jgi:hypothetical protein